MKFTSKTISFNVSTVDDLPTVDQEDGQVVIVKEKGRGGTFIYDSTKLLDNDGGTVFNGWVRQYDGAINIKWFGAKCDGITDDTYAVIKALIVGDLDLHRYSTNVSTLTLPENIKIYGNDATINVSGELTISSNCTLRNITLDMSNGGIVKADTANRIMLKGCSFRNSTVYGMLFNLGCTNIEIEDSSFFNNAGNGLYVQDVSGLNITNCKAYSNTQSGIYISSATEGLNNSGVRINSSICYDNGELSTYSGIIVARAKDVVLYNNICHTNQEHGISIQEVEDFSILSNSCYSNGQAGICPQSGFSGASTPVDNGIISGNILYDNDQGINFKEVCSNIIAVSNRIYRNSSYQIRLVDIASSGLKSTSISLKDNMLITTTGAVITNSNLSEYCSLNSIDNRTQTAYFPSMTNTWTTISESTLKTSGSSKDYPESIFVSDSVNAINYTAISEAVKGRKITLLAESDNLAIRHLQGTQGTNGQFVLSTQATTTLDIGSSISFIADGLGRWVETGRNIQVN